MNLIYWITRLDTINTILIITFIISLAGSLVSLLIYYCANGQSIHDKHHGYDRNSEENREYANTAMKSVRYFIPILSISTVLLVLVPTTKQALLIYGVGGTVDYLKQNPTAKQIPDKCINALDKWVDSWTEEKDSIK